MFSHSFEFEGGPDSLSASTEPFPLHFFHLTRAPIAMNINVKLLVKEQRHDYFYPFYAYRNAKSAETTIALGNVFWLTTLLIIIISSFVNRILDFILRLGQMLVRFRLFHEIERV